MAYLENILVPLAPNEPPAPVLSLVSNEVDKITLSWTLDYNGVINFCTVSRKLGDSNETEINPVSGTARTYEDIRIIDAAYFTYSVSCSTADEGKTEDSNSIIVIPVKLLQAP